MSTTRTRTGRSQGGFQPRLLVLGLTPVLGAAAAALSLFPGSPGCRTQAATGVMPRIRAVRGRLYAGRKAWRAWGFNWGVGDHSPVIAYLDDPTSAKLAVLACELRTARRLGANSMRAPVELQQVMKGPDVARPIALAALRRLLALATRDGVYLDITGNVVWRPQRAPDWYDRLSERARWQVQANFWRAVVHTAASFPSVLCYELTSEPLIVDNPGWYLGQYGGWRFVQIIAHPHGRSTRQLARAWTKLLVAAVRGQDNRPVTIGFLPFIQDGFTPVNVADLLDILDVHEYPHTGQAAEAIALIRHYSSFKKPVILGETDPLWSGLPTERAFLTGANRYLVGVFEFFDGRDPNHMTVKTIPDAIYQLALRQFIALRSTILKLPQPRPD